MTCPLCGSVSVKTKFPVSGDNIVHSCKNCGLEFLSPQLDDEALKKLYSEIYYAAWGLKGTTENEELKAMKIATFNLRLELVRKFQGTGAILDIGCATGYLLEAAGAKGFEPYGVEYSEYSASIAKQKFGQDRIFNGILEESNFPGNFFSVISMFDLIEHVRNLLTVMEYAAKLLKPGGVIIISTPDTGSISHKLMSKRWTHYKPEHFFYFNKKSMQLLAKKSNLKLLHYEKSKKALNLNYLDTQFKTYKHWFFSPVVGILNKCVPGKLKRHNFYIPIGEMTVILQRES